MAMLSAIQKVSTAGTSQMSSDFRIQDCNKEQIDDIIAYLKQACLEGSYRKFDYVAKALSSLDTEDDLLADWLKQLKDNIFFLDKENERITGTILDINWTSRNQYVTSNYHELMLNLVSAHTYYLRPVLLMIIRIFLSVKDEGGEISEEESKNFRLGHKLLKDIISLVPMAPDTLCALLNEKFPYFRRPAHLILCYAVNMLTISTYMLSHRRVLLEDLIDKCLQIDVHCPRDTIELCELEREEAEECLMDIEDPKEDMAYPLANSLDLLMESLFKFIESSCYNDSSSSKELNWEATKKLFRELLTVFDKLILPTHRCSHVQFIMMYICSLKPALCDGFLEYLWKKVKNPNTAPARRQMATFYIGSMLSRASFISNSTVTACLDLMCSWLHSYINNHDSKSSSDVGAHGTFHCVCQAVFYVFAFRHKDLIEMKNGFKYLCGLNFERIVTCRLNPLKFCHPAVVQNFANISRNYQIAYCYPVIERNNRSLLFGAVHSDNFAAMNTFFPFDPYLLKRSKKWIQPLYRIYKDHSDSDLIEKNEGEEEGDSVDMELHTTNSALFSYGSSPGFKQHLTVPSKVR